MQWATPEIKGEFWCPYVEVVNYLDSYQIHVSEYFFILFSYSKATDNVELTSKEECHVKNIRVITYSVILYACDLSKLSVLYLTKFLLNKTVLVSIEFTIVYWIYQAMFKLFKNI